MSIGTGECEARSDARADHVLDKVKAKPFRSVRTRKPQELPRYGVQSQQGSKVLVSETVRDDTAIFRKLVHHGFVQRDVLLGGAVRTGVNI